MAHFTMTPSYSVVSAFGAAIQDQFILASKEEEGGKKAGERIGSFTRAYGVIERWNRFIMAHPRNPFPNCASNLILSSRHGCTISMNSDRPQEYKTALMPHLLKQQDYFIKLESSAEPLDKFALGARNFRWEKEDRVCFKNIFFLELSLFKTTIKPFERHC